LFVTDSKINLTTTASQTDPNFTRGNLTGDFKLSANILAVGARFTF